MNTNENDFATEEIRRIVREELDRTRSGATTSLYRRKQGLLQSVTEGLQTRWSSTMVPSTSDQPSPLSATPGNSPLTQVQIPLCLRCKFPVFGVHQKRKGKDQKANPAIPIVLNPTRNLAHQIKLKHFVLICILKILKWEIGIASNQTTRF